MYVKPLGYAVALLMFPIISVAGASVSQCRPESFGGQPGIIATSAIQRAIDYCNAHGGGKVVLTKGVWISGPLILKSNIILKIEKGAILKSKKSKKGFVAAFIDYPAKKGEALILANGVRNVGIVGDGIIMGNGLEWWGEADKVRNQSHKVFEQEYPGIPPTNGMPRPWLVEFNNVSNGVVKDVHLWSSPMWTLVIRSSHDIDIRNITVRNPRHTPNTDGVDIVSSSNVNVIGSTISTGDDDIAIKSGLKQGVLAPINHIKIKNDVFLNGGGVAIGSETANGIHDVEVSNVKFFGTSHGIRVKSARDRGNKIGPETVNDVTMRNVEYPLLINERFGEHFASSGGKELQPLQRQPLTKTTPFINAITVANLTATGAKIALILSGLPESHVKEILLKNVYISSKYGGLTRYVDGTFRDVRIKAEHGRDLIKGPGTNLKVN